MKKKVLIVDDDPVFVEVVKNRLAQENYETRTACNRVEFTRQALQESPDIILLDIMLGNDNGPEIYRHLIAEGFDPEVPVIIMSSLCEDEPPTKISQHKKVVLHSKFFSPFTLLQEIKKLTLRKAA